MERTIRSQCQINQSKLIASMVTLTSVLLISIVVFVVLQLLTPWLFPGATDYTLRMDWKHACFYV